MGGKSFVDECVRLYFIGGATMSGNLNMNTKDIVIDSTTGTTIGQSGSKIGFYGTAGIVKQTGVTVDAAGIHAALVALGLIGA